MLVPISCRQGPSALRTYHAPENINDGLQVGTMDEVNIDKSYIEKAINDIERGKYGEVHSLLIYKDDRLVVEEYFTGHRYQWDAPDHHGELVTFTSSTVHALQSVTKSITSACTGIAVDNGFIQNVDQSIFDYLPDYQYLNTDGKDKITVEHLVTMTSGLKWDEWSRSLGSESNDIVGIWFSDKGPIEYVLEKPLKYEPGTRFTYSGGCMIVLGEVIKNASGMNIAEFSQKYLFDPLEADSFEWWEQFENGVYETGGGLKGTPRDMVKIGVTYLNNGVWEGKQIISEEWVKNSATTFPASTGIKVPGEDYGRVGRSYSWWTKEFSSSGKDINMFWAGGWGGQHIMVFPGLNMVIVFTGGNYTSKARNFTILEKYILPAIG
jgi:CubicO group peptidase (beta-lactamase class C family)